MGKEEQKERVVEVRINPDRIKALLVIQDKTGIPVETLIDAALKHIIQINQNLFVKDPEPTKKLQ